MKGYKKHIFICENLRDADSPKGSCGRKSSSEIKTKLKAALKARCLEKVYRANTAGCLGMCEHGPTVVIYPQGVWYGGVTIDDVDEILEKSILADEIIERLLIKDAKKESPDEKIGFA
ncbi:MAG: ferredoxin [Calditrichaceae bacterium]